MTKNKIVLILFHKDTFLLIAVLFWLWFTISLITDEHYNFNELKQHKGAFEQSKIVITKIVNKPLFKDTTRQLRLWLSNDSSYFYISADSNFNNILSSFSLEDSLNIYTKEKSFGIFGLGNNRLISHMENVRTGKIIVDFQQVQASAARLKYISGIATLIFAIWFVIRIRKRIYS